MKLTTCSAQAIQRILADNTISLDDRLAFHKEITKLQEKLAGNASVKVILTSIISSNPLWEVVQGSVEALIRKGDVGGLKEADILLSQRYPDIDFDQCFQPRTRLGVVKDHSICDHPSNHNRILLAIEHSQPEILKYLLDNGYNCNSSDCNGKTALMQAIAHKNLESIAILLGCKDINLNARSYYGDTALSIAIQQGNYSLVESLLNHKNNIDLNMCLSGSHTALTLAMQKNDDYIVALLCRDNRVNTQKQHFINGTHGIGLLGHRLEYTPLMIAIEDRKWKYVADLLPRSTHAEREEISRLLNRNRGYLYQKERDDVERAKDLLHSYSPIELLRHAMGSFLEDGVSEMLSSNHLADIDAQHPDGTISVACTRERRTGTV